MAGPWENYSSGDGPWAKYAEPATLNPNLAAQGVSSETAREAGRSALDVMSARDPGIDYTTGIKDARFRAGFSRMTNDAEKANYLDLTVGKNKWGKDSHGAYFIKPEGLPKFGTISKIPVSIDEQSTSRYDVADIAGDLPSILGSTGMGIAASGAGLIPGMAASALGAAGGKALDELVKNLQGLQFKSPTEVGTALASEAAMSAAGEGGARTLFPIARKFLGPEAARMTPEKAALAKSAQEQGFKIQAGQVTDAPLLARFEGMLRNIFNDLYAEQNQQAAKRGMQTLAPNAVSKEQAGGIISSSVKAARVQFGERMSEMYKAVDDLVGNQPFVPTQPLKDIATKLLEGLPKTEKGAIVGGTSKAGATASFLQDILNMGEAMTASQAQRLRTMLREAADSPNIVPDVAKHEARELKKAIDASLEQAGNVGEYAPEMAAAAKQLRQTDAAYRAGIAKFDTPVISAITRSASKSGAVDADMVVDYLIKPDRVVRLRQVKQLMSPEQWTKVKDAHAQDLASSLLRGTDDPLVTVFDGRAFRDTLNKYGREVLEEVHGRQWVDQAYKYASALMLAEKKMNLSGGIVAANIALHPVKNLPQLIYLRAIAKVMSHPATFKYLTEGVTVGDATKGVSSAITRLATQIMANARDETGSARFSVEAQ